MALLASESPVEYAILLVLEEMIFDQVNLKRNDGQRSSEISPKVSKDYTFSPSPVAPSPLQRSKTSTSVFEARVRAHLIPGGRFGGVQSRSRESNVHKGSSSRNEDSIPKSFSLEGHLSFL